MNRLASSYASPLLVPSFFLSPSANHPPVPQTRAGSSALLKVISWELHCGFLSVAFGFSPGCSLTAFLVPWHLSFQALEKYDLTLVERLQLANMRPSTVVEVHLLVEACEERLGEDGVQVRPPPTFLFSFF